VTAAKKSKKATKTKASAEVTELKSAVAALEAQKVSLTAKADSLEKELKALKASSKNAFIISAAAGSAAVILLIILIAVLSGGRSAEKKEKQDKNASPGREKHYEDIEYHVLNDWQNIWFHPENIDMNLYADLKNHFPELHSSIEEWKKAMNERQELALEMGRELSRLHPDVETMPYVYMLAYEEPNVFIEDTEIKSGPYLCAQSKSVRGDREMMNAYYDSCMKLFAKKPYDEIRSLNGDIINYKSDIDLKIRKIKFTRDLPGDCGFL
jgi:hypothetical protein